MNIVEIWPIVSGVGAALFVGLVWLVRTDSRLKILEEKVRTLFNLWNSKK
jgi:hypothetical protein